MTETLRGIVLGVVKHSDRANVITLYTRERGREAFVVAAGTGRAAQMRSARLQLLSVVEFQSRRRPGNGLPYMSSAVPVRIWHTLYQDPVKTSLLLFMGDFLNRLLRESVSEPLMWDFITGELERLDGMERGMGNFHLEFLMGILTLAGICPDWEGWQEGAWFDMRSGEFTVWKPRHGECLVPEEAKAAARLLRAGSRALGRLRFGKRVRGRILDVMLEYSGVHYPGTGYLPSLEILRTVAGT